MVWQVLLAYNGLVFLVYGWDKWQAKRAARRVPERTLLWLAGVAGGPGALLGMYGLRHKTRKPKFTWGVGLMTLVQVGILIWGRYRGWW